MSKLETNAKLSYQPPVAEDVVEIDIGRLLEHPDNPRGPVVAEDCTELAASVAEQGVIEPLIVVAFRDAFRIVAGARRRMAGKLNNLPRLPCIIRKMTEEQQRDVMLIENLQRKDLTYTQTARAFVRMVQEDKASKQSIVRRIGCSTSFVTNLLELARLAPSVQALIDSGRLSLSCAPALARLEDEEQQKQLAAVALQRRLGLAGLQKAVDELVGLASLGQDSQSVRAGRKNSKRRVLGSNESFTRSDAIAELNHAGIATFEQLAAAFDDVCLGTCVESHNLAMCEACPVPRFIMSVLRRVSLTPTDTAPLPANLDRASHAA